MALDRRHRRRRRSRRRFCHVAFLVEYSQYNESSCRGHQRWNAEHHRGTSLMRTSIALIFALASHCHGQPAIVPPQLGFVQDSTRSLRPVYGVAGNFILGRSVVGQVISEAFSGSVGLLKTDSSLLRSTPRVGCFHPWMCRPGLRSSRFHLQPARHVAYIASNNSLVGWRGDGFASISLNDDLATQTVLAIAFPNCIPSITAGPKKRYRSGTQPWKFFRNRAPGHPCSTARAPIGRSCLSRNRGNRHSPNRCIRSPRSRNITRQSLAATNESGVGTATDLNSNARFAIRTTQGREGFYRLPEITPSSPRSGLLNDDPARCPLGFPAAAFSPGAAPGFPIRRDQRYRGGFAGKCRHGCSPETPSKPGFTCAISARAPHPSQHSTFGTRLPIASAPSLPYILAPYIGLASEAEFDVNFKPFHYRNLLAPCWR